MFSSTLALLALAATAFAVPQGNSQCNNPSGIQCCESTYPAGSDEGKLLITALGLDHATYNHGLVAASCGGGGTNVGGGSSCTNTPVCCENNSFGGLLGIGCTPIILGL